MSIEADRLVVTGLTPGEAPQGFETWDEPPEFVTPETNEMLLGVIQNSQGLVAQINTVSAAHDLKSNDP